MLGYFARLFVVVLLVLVLVLVLGVVLGGSDIVVVVVVVVVVVSVQHAKEHTLMHGHTTVPAKCHAPIILICLFHGIHIIMIVVIIIFQFLICILHCLICIFISSLAFLFPFLFS